MDYKPGDVVNGHVLGEDNQWHPIQAGWGAPGQEQPAQPVWQAQQPGAAGGQPWPQQPGAGGPAPGPGPWATQTQPAGQLPGPPKPSGPIYKRWWFWVAAGLLVVVVGVVAAAAVAIRAAVESVATSTSSTTTRPRITMPTRATATSTPTSRVTSGGQIGQPVRDEALEFTVTSVECGMTDLGRSALATPDGTFCLVYIKATNVGTEIRTLTSFAQKAIDSTGREIDLDSGTQVLMSGSSDYLKEIAPGATVSGPLVFDVRAGATLAAVELHDSFLSDGARIALS